MRSRSRRRFFAALRLLALAVLALSLLLRPVLSSMGEIHELAHDPTGQHLDVDHSAGPTAHSESKEGKEGKGAGALHAFLHFAHCCGQATVGPPDLAAHVADSGPSTRLLDLGTARPPVARWTTPFRPPIAS